MLAGRAAEISRRWNGLDLGASETPSVLALGDTGVEGVDGFSGLEGPSVTTNTVMAQALRVSETEVEAESGNKAVIPRFDATRLPFQTILLPGPVQDLNPQRKLKPSSQLNSRLARKSISPPCPSSSLPGF